MKQPKSILIFGGGELQVSLIKNVKELGYQAIVIDPIQDAEGRAEADVFVPLAADDYEGTLKLAKDYNVSAVITTALDNPLPMMARIAKMLDLRFPTEESIQNVLDKASFKRILQVHHLPCAEGNSFNVGKLPDFSKIDYPVIVKPNKNSGSRGVVLCENKTELENAIDNVAQFCKDKRFIVEEYLRGDEISVEGIVNEGKFTLVQITDKIVSPPPYNVEMGHVQPSQYAGQKEKIHSLLQRIVEVTGLNDCGIHAEIKINDNGIFIIELGPRLGGDYITSDLVPLSTGVNIEKVLVHLSLGLPYEIRQLERCSTIQYLSVPPQTRWSANVDYDDIMNQFPSLKRIKVYLKANEVVKPITDSLNRHGYWVLGGEDKEEMMKQSEAIRKVILKNVGG